MAVDLELLGEFLLEGKELLERLDRDLVELEKAPKDQERLAGIFRALHTLKGTSTFIPLPKLSALAHAGENLLGALRDGRVEATPPVITTLLAMIDGLKSMLGEAEACGTDGDDPLADLIARLSAHEHDTVANPELPAARDPAEPRSPQLSAGQSVRVDVALLDRMMNLVAELVLARNQLLRSSAAFKDPAFADASARLNLLTTELHEGVTKTRLQPIGSLFEKLPRVVRDLARDCGKEVELLLEGGDTELDRTLLEGLKDPLIHLVRNAIDHGIESPARRREKGKPEQGWLKLRAFHQGGRVHLEVSDDGAGVDVERVKQVAIERGLIDPARAERLSERDAIALVFQPGFSTAEKVTHLSGRGVGMDVVKTNIERISGNVDVRSVRGEGTTIAITLPLTLAIVPALIVSAGAERFAIPQASLVEVIALDGAHSIEHLHGAAVFRLRGSLLPVAWLTDVLRLGGCAPVGQHLVVLQSGQYLLGLVVDEVFDTEEIVVKPLGPSLERLGVYAGATVMGDGGVALILDVAGLGRRARLLGSLETAPARPAPASSSTESANEPLVLFVAGASPLALPLSKVASIEEIGAEKVAAISGRRMIEYRGQLLPLADLGLLLGRAAASQGSVLQVLVFSAGGRQLGLIVEKVIDVVDAPAGARSPSNDGRFEGTAVVQGQLTELVDVGFLQQRAA